MVAQDITRYGLDLYGRRTLAQLLPKLCAIEGIQWVRLHYLYPDEITDELIDVIALEPKICLLYTSHTGGLIGGTEAGGGAEKEQVQAGTEQGF